MFRIRRLKLFCVLVFILVLLPTLLKPGVIFAHTGNNQPFFKINGVYATMYPIPTSSVTEFVLPQDVAPANYLLGETIHFELVARDLGMPEQLVNATQYSWDFGDGTKGAGLLSDHIYERSGSYILTITQQAGKDSPPQRLQSILLHVVPHKEYLLPRAQLSVNEKQSRDPISDYLAFDMSKPLTFDASKSATGSATKLVYFWDFGDGQSSSEPKVDHQYDQRAHETVFAVLRVKNTDGFIADTYVQINDLDKSASSTAINSPKLSQYSSRALLYIGIGFITIVGISIWMRKKK